ncbi:helix-turn-helix domain-containing protein [Saliphagus sp. LR7]|uniref:helix-turn-helix domain-containing protein n=1 Tax=Saliphagus sp. LR7 TaxID=2282654 RepID=UPI000DF8012A|nr:helix-turn-helix domain-containing protein [Saliphagus sp. LR7]
MGASIVEVEVGIEDFALEQTINTIENIEFKAERIVAKKNECLMPYLWAEAPSFDGLDEMLANDETVGEVELVADLEDERLYRMSWVRQVEILFRILVEEDGTVLSAQTTNTEGWHFRILFPTRDELARAYDDCQANGVDLNVKPLYNIDEGRQGRFGLTDGQEDALVDAFERGYYEIPREIDLEGLASEFDISHQALSERFRRGHKSLVENTLIIDARDRDTDS